MKRLVAGLCAACSLGPCVPLQAQVPGGPEFRVNTYTTRSQYQPAVAMDGGGNFVVVWTSGRQDAGYAGIFGQRYDAAGAPRGSEFQVNTYATGQQLVPSVAADGAGGFVVVWMSYGQDGSRGGVFGRRYDTTGVPRGSEFQVNSYTTAYQYAPSVASGAKGDFVVVWIGYGQDRSADGVFARRYDAAGQPLAGEFQVNTYTSGNQGLPTQGPATVALDASGGLVITWPSFRQDGDAFGVFAQRYDATGAGIGAEFQVNTFTTSTQGPSAVAAAADGHFVVTWTGGLQDGSGFGLFARRYDAAGSALGPEFQVNTYATGQQGGAAIAADAGGGFVITWTSGHDDGSYGVFAQRYDRGGTPRGSEFRVNTYTTSQQSGSPGAVASDPAGNFVVTWTSYGQDESFFGVFGQRYGGLRPSALAVDALGNGVLDPGETATVAPAWRNVNGAPQTFAGSASAFTGPGTPNDPIYTIVDGAASYGTVADGAQGSCSASGNCYALSLSAPTTRPAQHWDARFTEDLAPAAQGQSKTWTLHVSREQMAVFVLRTLDPTLDPPACGTPVFADVPAASPFCRWIEELARRGVVTGCGGGNYCPTAPVRREQMGVFISVGFGLTLYGP